MDSTSTERQPQQSWIPAWAATLSRKIWLAVFIASQLAFAVYIYILYGGALILNSQKAWDHIFNNIHVPNELLANIGIISHLYLAAVIMIIGPLQFVSKIREKTPKFHRWSGRTFLLCAGLTSIGGMVFILTRGTVGGTVMNWGFGSYGVLLFLCAVQAWRKARAAEYQIHRIWAIRVFILCTCSWMWRLDYIAWAVITDCTRGGVCGGHTPQFTGPFDDFMAFAFYIVPMIFLELYFHFDRSKKYARNPMTSNTAILVTLPILIVGAIGIFVGWWLPGIKLIL